MKKTLKIFAYALLMLIAGIVCLLSYLRIAYPKVAKAEDMHITATPETVARGAYLANHVCLCVDCHSARDFSKFGAPVIAGTIGQGGEHFDHRFGFPGDFSSKNITPYHLADWTDGEVYRAITTGVSKDGHALFPVMPYLNFGQMDTNDIRSIVAYLRTLPAVESDVGESKADFPMNFIINTIPQEAKPQPLPPKTDPVNYGRYVITAAGCKECHTKHENGKAVGEPFAGGSDFPMPDGSIVRSANLTPDKETGIGTWTKEVFIRTFKSFADSGYRAKQIKPGDTNTIMPWDMYAGMDTTDLAAIFAYLQTVKPVHNNVNYFSAPAQGKQPH